MGKVESNHEEHGEKKRKTMALKIAKGELIFI